MTQTPAGWYPNPTDPNEEIYWAGDAWSTSRRPVAPAARSEANDENLTVPISQGDIPLENVAQGTPTQVLSAHDSSRAPSDGTNPIDNGTTPPSGATTPSRPLKTWAVVLAVIALVTAVIPGASFATWLFAIPAIALGLVALIRFKQTRGQALFAVIGGAIAWLLAIVVSVVFISGLGASTSTSGVSEPSSSRDAPVEESPAPTAEELAEIAAEEAADEAAKAADEAAKAAEQAAAAAAEEAARGTVSQQNAQRSGQNYLDFTAFSRTGLVKQLEFEGFSTEDASWGVDRVTVDWNEQAAKSAKNYLEFTSFSRSGLIDQLLFEGFTPEQAEYGVSQTGL